MFILPLFQAKPEERVKGEEVRTVFEASFHDHG
jgi:hypothetical protein